MSQKILISSTNINYLVHIKMCFSHAHPQAPTTTTFSQQPLAFQSVNTKCPSKHSFTFGPFCRGKT